jgi:hypothetical protein
VDEAVNNKEQRQEAQRVGNQRRLRTTTFFTPHLFCPLGKRHIFRYN